MWMYLLKFSTSLLILLLFYKLVLEKVHIHHFKRYYLLAAFVIALGIPLITFTQYVPLSAAPFSQSSLIASNVHPQLATTNNINFIPFLLWGIYTLGVVVFTIKFLRNLRSLINNIQQNPKLRSGKLLHVLLQEKVAPHTFFSYLFFNLKNYKSNKIPQEVFWHEEAHAAQKHSLDVLLLELLQIVLWFNPLIYWAKNLVKLNHEFLADQAVLKKGAVVPDYQKLVLAFSSNPETPLANAIHYSSIKKRIVIMKTQTSQKAIWLKSLLLLPLMALLLYSFSTKEILPIPTVMDKTILPDYQNEQPSSDDLLNDTRTQRITDQEIILSINKFGQLMVKDDLVKLENLKSHLLNYNQNLSKEQRSKLLRAVIRVDKETPKSIIRKAESILMEYGVATIDIKEHIIPEIQEGATKKEIKEYNELAKNYNAQPINEVVVKYKEVQRMKYLYNRMSDTQRKSAQPFPNFPPPPTPSAPKSSKAEKGTKVPPPPPPAPAPTVKKGGKDNFPPPPPPLKNPNQGNYSDELLTAYKKFNNKADTYAQAIGAYNRKGEGTLLNLQTLYEETLVLHDSYVELAKKEGLMSPTKATPKDHE